jgi:hypothetical protein
VDEAGVVPPQPAKKRTIKAIGRIPKTTRKQARKEGIQPLFWSHDNPVNGRKRLKLNNFSALASDFL